MANYIAQQEAALAKASRDKRDADQRLEIANGRYDAAKENTAGAGRGKQGGPTANERSTAQKYAKGGKVPRVEAMEKREIAKTPSTRSELAMSSRKIVAPARRSVPVAARKPMLAMKKGGKAAQW